jgi:hypothetical protein
MIHSDPIEIKLVNLSDLSYRQTYRPGGSYESFEKFWSYAKLLGRGAVAAALPSRP